MLTLILTFLKQLNWRIYAAGIAVIAVLFAANSVSNAYKQAALVPALQKQLQATIDACNKNNEITRKTSYAYQTELQNLNNKLANIKRLRPNKCVVLTTDSTSGLNAAASTTINDRQNGLSSDWLYEYAGEAERYRLQVIFLQSFINAERS